MASEFTLEKLVLLYTWWAPNTFCRHTGLLLGKRLGAILQRHRIRKYPDSPSTRYRIREFVQVADLFFPLWRADSKISGFVAEFAGCVWTKALSGKKKLPIQTEISGYVLTGPQFS